MQQRIRFCRECQREMHREFARSQRPIPNKRLCEPCDEKLRPEAEPYVAVWSPSFERRVA
jgi:hypothetical protein